MPTLTLDESTLRKAERNAAKEGFGTVADYVEDLIYRDVIDDMPLSFTTKEEFEALILEGLESPSSEMTKADWQKLRDDLVSKARTGSQYASQTH